MYTRYRYLLLLVGVTVLVIGSLLTLLRSQGQLQFLELAAYDVLLSIVNYNRPVEPLVTVVVITETDIRRLGNWPRTDAQLADAGEGLLALDPSVLGVDIYRDLAVEPGSERLQALLLDSPRVIAIEKFPGSDSPGIPPPPALRATERVGFSDLVADPGGIIRRNLLFQNVDRRVGYSFALRLALRHLAGNGIYPSPGEPDPRHLRLGEVTLAPLDSDAGGYVDADTGGYQIMLDYMGGPTPFRAFSLEALHNGGIPRSAITDRIVILGVAAESVRDYFTTPYAILNADAGTVTGSAVHAHAAYQLVDIGVNGRRPLRSWPEYVEIVWVWAWLGLGFASGWYAGSAWRFSLIEITGVILVVNIAFLGFYLGWWIPLVPNAAAWLIALALSNALFAGQRRRDHQELKSLFSCQVSPQVAEMIWRHRDEVLVNGRIRPQTMTATVLFSDLQGFTRVSESMEPDAFLDWLNTYLSVLTQTIMRHGGVLDDYAGDGIKANFGVPVRREDRESIRQDALNAVRCACELAAVTTRLNGHWRELGRPCVALRVGIHTGPVTAGTVGSSERMKYTTIGRHVNLGSRLESLKEIEAPDVDDDSRNCRILVSADSAELVAGDVELVDLGSYRLKGIQEETRVFRVECPEGCKQISEALQ